MPKKKKKVDWKQYEKFVHEFRDESDRAAVVLGAAKLDLVMYQILNSFLIPCPNNKDELLEGDSPLGTFSAKINLIYRLGLIDAGFARAIHIIRRIRNSFAHEVSGCTLSSGAHSDRIKELSLPFKHLPFYVSYKTHFFGDSVGLHIEFRAVLGILVGRLENLLSNVDTIEQENAYKLVVPAWEEDLKSFEPQKKV